MEEEDQEKNKIFDEGKPTEECYQNGPVDDRGCTDILCCLLFLGFCSGMAYISYIGWQKGDPYLLLAPFASDNTQCGIGFRSDQPYLFLPNLIYLPTDMFKDTVCVAQCPKKGNSLFTGIVTAYQYDSSPLFERYCLPADDESRESFFENAGAEKIGQYLSDLYIAWKVLAFAAGVAFVLTMLYMIFIRCCAEVMVWLTFLTFLVLLGVLGFFFWEKAQESLDDGDKLNYKILAIMFWAIDGIVLLVICCLYDDIQVALSIIMASGEFIFSTCQILFVPFFAMIIAVGFFLYWIWFVLYIYSIGDISQYGNTPFSSVNWEDSTRNMWYYQLFGLFWVLAFLLASLQFIVAATAAQWYFSHTSDQAGKGSVCKSLWWIFRYHIGSLAFGSLILSIVMFVRFIFEYMKRKIDEGEATNRLSKCLISCMTCCLSYMGRCVIFITKNAYIQIAIRSVCFCSGAYKAFQLVLRNAVRFLLVNSFAAIFTFFGKIAIAIGSAFSGYMLVTSWEEVKDKVYTYIIPTIACFIIGYILANIFLTVYDLACSAILQCFLIDEESAFESRLASGRHRPPLLDPFFESIQKNADEFR